MTAQIVFEFSAREVAAYEHDSEYFAATMKRADVLARAALSQGFDVVEVGYSQPDEPCTYAILSMDADGMDR